MKTVRTHLRLLRWLCWSPAGLATGVAAQTLVFDLGIPLPDGSATGVADVRTVTGVPAGAIPTVGLTLSGLGSGMINGDLYATLTHEDDRGRVDGFVVLLNRPGRSLGSEDGYFDNGLDLRLAPEETAPDIHLYRSLLDPAGSTPLAGPLTGRWSADGRVTDPDRVLDTDPRSTGLADFRAIDANRGRWILFAADLGAGGTARLDGWSLAFTAIPEVPSIATCSLAAVAVWLVGRHRHRRGGSGRAD